MDIDIEQLRELMRSISEFDVNEIEIENGDERISLRRGLLAESVVVASAAPAVLGQAAQPAGAAPAPSTPGAEEQDDNAQWVTSPFVGTFYRAPSPDADPFVAVGSSIQTGTVLCIVEAMKLMNEIESEISGTILDVLVENGKPVEYGDRLFKVTK